MLDIKYKVYLKLSYLSNDDEKKNGNKVKANNKDKNLELTI